MLPLFQEPFNQQLHFSNRHLSSQLESSQLIALVLQEFWERQYYFLFPQ